MLQESLQTRFEGSPEVYTTTQISVKSQVPPLLPLPLLQRPLSSPRLSKLLSLSLRLRRDLAKLVIKARGLRGSKTRVRARRKSPLQKPKTLPRTQKMQQRQRKQRPRLEKLILRPRTLPPPSRARKRTFLPPRPRLRTQDFLVVIYYYFFLVVALLSRNIMYSLFLINECIFLSISCVFTLHASKLTVIANNLKPLPLQF